MWERIEPPAPGLEVHHARQGERAAEIEVRELAYVHLVDERGEQGQLLRLFLLSAISSILIRMFSFKLAGSTTCRQNPFKSIRRWSFLTQVEQKYGTRSEPRWSGEVVP